MFLLYENEYAFDEEHLGTCLPFLHFQYFWAKRQWSPFGAKMATQKGQKYIRKLLVVYHWIQH